MNIIITNVGRRGYLVDYIKEVPAFSGKVYVSDCDRTASGLYNNKCDGQFILPRPLDNDLLYVNALLKLCKEKDIQVVIPVIDPEIYILSSYKEKFENEGIKVIVSDSNVLNICYDKLQMNIFLDEIGLKYPLTYKNINEFENAYNNHEIIFPVMLKPILGSGSVDTHVIHNVEKLRGLYHEGMIIQEHIYGEEYGIDVFNNFEGKPIRCVIKKKISMRSGETDKAISVIDNNIRQHALCIANKLKHIGNLDCDILAKDGEYYVIDMNPRFGGGYPATHILGVNLIGVLLELCGNNMIEEEFDNYKPDVLIMKEISISSVDMSVVNNIERRE